MHMCFANKQIITLWWDSWFNLVAVRTPDFCSTQGSSVGNVSLFLLTGLHFAVRHVHSTVWMVATPGVYMVTEAFIDFITFSGLHLGRRAGVWSRLGLEVLESSGP